MIVGNREFNSLDQLEQQLREIEAKVADPSAQCCEQTFAKIATLKAKALLMARDILGSDHSDKPRILAAVGLARLLTYRAYEMQREG